MKQMQRTQQRWHGQGPANPADARRRLLDAASACFARLGVQRTTVEDIASEAGVHRSTVYEYFANRDAVLVEVFEREAEAVIAAVAHHLGAAPFPQALVTAITLGVELTRRSPNLEFLLGTVRQGRAARTSLTMDLWAEFVRTRLAGPMSAAVARGEVRDDVPLQDILTWVVRVALSVTADPTEDVAQTLSWFLLPALCPPTAPANGRS